MNRGEKFIHPYHGEVTLVDIVDDGHVKVKCANGIEHHVTTEWLKPVAVDAPEVIEPEKTPEHLPAIEHE